MSEQTPEVLFEGFFGRFETDLNDLQTTSLQGSIGRGRVAIREKIKEAMRVAGFKIEVKLQITLIERFAKELVQRKEYSLAEDCFQYILNSLVPALVVNAECTQVFKSTTKASIEYQRVFASYKKEIGSSAYARVSPVAVTRLLLCLQDLRSILKAIFEELPAAKDQEEVAWLILNGCKLILRIAQPLVWLSCGRYVTDSIIFASLCMEAVVNLCTCRHLKFRMKLYTTAFYSTMVGSSSDDSKRMLDKIGKELNELRDREYIDPPVPEKVEIVLLQADLDIATMRAVHNFWANPDSMASGVLNDDAALRVKFNAPAINNDYKDKYSSIFGRIFTERVLCEYIRIHQLTSGNINEPYKRRTVAILRGFDALSVSFPTREVEVPKVKISAPEDVDADGGDEEEKAGAVTVTVTDCPLSTICLLELLTVSQFEELPEGGSAECDVLSIQKKIFSYTKTKSVGTDTNKSSMKSTFDAGTTRLLNVEDDTSKVEASLLEQLAVLVALSQGQNYIDQIVATVKLSQAVDKMLYSPVMSRRKGFLRNLSISLWQRGVFPQLQRALSDLSSDSLLPLKVMSTTLVCLVKTIDLTKIEDPLLLASLSLVTARILGHFGDMRGAIALLLQSIETIDEHRAARVDLALHMPVDTRDISALQRASITTQAEAQDWYHSVKRLGAHAFAGFGVFGAGSQTERTDSALGELHADIIALYFRYELEYAIERKHMRHKMKAKLWTQDGRRVKPEVKRGAGLGLTQDESVDLSTTEEAGKMAATAMPFGMETIIQFDEEALGQVKKFTTDQLPVVAQLKSWCERNTYAQAILNVELARIEKTPEKAVKLLNDACHMVEESELEEEAVKKGISDLTLLTTEPQLRAPLIIARSHKFIYTVPVGSKSLQEKKPVDYYRIFCKEEKNASLVTLVNDEIDGCEKRISVRALNVDNQLSECVCRAGNLRWGQKYVFAAAAFDAKDKNIGAIGPTSLGVTAVNPLPNLLIWTYIYKVASELAIPTTKAVAAGHVCDRFFLANPNQGSAVLSIGKGINILVGEEPALCMLAVQQASPVTLAAFAAAYLAVLSEEKPGSTLTGPVNSANKGVPEGMRRTEQWKVLTQLRRISIVSVIACYSQQVDLVVQCVVKGYELAASLLFSDERHLGNMLQNPLITLLIALQNIPKRHWHELEHNLYCRLLHHVLKLAISNRSTASVVPILNRVFEESDKNLFVPGQTNEVNVSSQSQYIALERLVRREAAVYGKDKVASTSVETQFNSVFEALTAAPAAPAESTWYNPNQGYLWKRGQAALVHSILETGRDAVLAAAGEPEPVAKGGKGAPPPVASKVQLTGKPELMSDLLASFVALIKSTKGVEEDKAAFTKTMAYLPIYDKLLAPEVLAAHEQWGLGLVKPLPEQPKEPEGPADVAPVEGDTGTPQKIKQKFDPLAQYAEVSAGEKNSQLCALGEICFLRALRFSVGTENVKRNYFPDPKNGPEMAIDMTDSSLFVQLPESRSNPPRAVDAPFEKIDYVRNMGAALCMYASAGCPAAACGVASRLWNFIVDQWVSPAVFAKEFVSLHANLKELLASLISAIKFLLQNCGGTGLNSAYELQSSLADLGDKDNNSVALQKTQAEVVPVADETITPLVLEDMLNSAQFILIFMVKVQWLHKQMLNVIDYGSAVVDCYLSVNQPALCKNVGETCMPLVLTAQEVIIEGVESELVAFKKSADDCVHAFDELMKKKRRKKTRVAKVEKDDDDIRHESDMEEIQRSIDETESRLEFNKERLRLLKLQFKRFETLFPTGIQLLNKVRISRNAFLQDCFAAFGSNNNEDDTSQFGLLVQENAALTQVLDEVLDAYDQVTNFLREKKDKIALIEALREQGDLLLLFGMNSQARNIWHDGLDGLFNAMDTYKSWKEVSSNAIQDMYVHQDVEMLRGMITAVDVLAKLSKYCAATDWDMKTNYSRFAAELCRAPFLESYGHPVTLLGFAAYVCKDLGGSYSFILPSDKGVLASLALSLEEIANVMKDNNLYMQALPVVVLLEHIHSSYTHRAELWLSARVLRVKLLVGARLFAQAASMLATIQYSVQTITNHTFNDLLAGAGPVLDKQFDTSANGLDFHGKAAFYNHLPPDDDKNKAALEWIGTFAKDLETFLATFVIKNKAGEEKLLFSVPVISEASIQVGRFLIEVSLLDGKVTASHSAFLAQQGDKGLAILQEVAATKIGGDKSNDLVFPYQRWIKQYCACVLLKSDVLIKRRQPMEARRHLIKLLELLQTSNVKTYISMDTRAYMAYTWLQVRDKLVDIAVRQYRLADAIKLSTLAVGEAAITCNGYWIRSLLLRRAIANYKFGKLFDSRTDCDSVLRLYDDAQLFDVLQLRCLSLKCSILRDMLSGKIAFEDNLTQLTDSIVLDKSIDMLHSAYEISEKMCSEVGFLGADVNVTFMKADSNVAKHHYLPPLLHSLTAIHTNEPELTKKYREKLPRKNDGKPNTYSIKQKLRPGPIDSNEKQYSQSEYVNIYLKEVKLLADCHAALAAALDEKRELEEVVDSNEISQTLLDQTSFGENALKLLRHIVFASPHTRSTLLHLVGRSRTAMSDTAPTVSLGAEEEKNLTFFTSLDVARTSAHDWYLMRRSCIQLVCYFYDRATATGPLGAVKDPRNAKANLAKATQFMMCGVKLGKQIRTIEKDSVRVLAADKTSFGAAPSVDLAKLLDSSIRCSSSTEQTKRSVKGAAAPAAEVDPKAKGKPAPGGATAIPASTATARDAVFMLSSIMLDFEETTLDTDDRNDYCDVDKMLKAQYPHYNTLCNTAQIPKIDSADAVTVPADSVSSLWVPTKTVANFPLESLHANFGRFSHVVGYFLFGGATPTIKRLIAQRADIVHVRKGLFKLQKDLTFAVANPGAEGNLFATCGALFAKIMELLCSCFRDGYIDVSVPKEGEETPTKTAPAKCVVHGQGAATSLNISIPSKDEGGEAIDVEVAMSAEIVAALSDLLCCDKDVDAIVQASACSLVRALMV